MPNETPLAINKQAYHDYEIVDTHEAGIQLTGAEVKSCKGGGARLRGSYAMISLDAIPYLVGCHIMPYKQASGHQKDYDPTRSRRLLLHAKEINTLIGKLKEKRYTLVPLSIYSKNGLIKISLGLGRGKKEYEKRATIKKRDVEREIGRRLKH